LQQQVFPSRALFPSLTSHLEHPPPSDVVKLLVGNKIDLGNREVSREEGLAFAKSKAMVQLASAHFATSFH